MAASLFNLLVEPGAAHAISAGTEPGARVHPEVLTAMKELGVDLSSIRPRLLTDELAGTADFVITMGCGDECPIVPHAVRDDWELVDPKGRPIDEVRVIRDDIRRRVETLIEANGWSRARSPAPAQGTE
jgi:arsenate reductase